MAIHSISCSVSFTSDQHFPEQTLFFFFSLSVFLLLLCAAPVSGADPGSHPLDARGNGTVMQEVVVTASRVPEEASRIPASVTVIKEEEIKNSTARNVPELLRTQGGVQVTDIAGNQRNYSVDLRGFGDSAGQNTLVLVDGRRVTQADLSGTDWTQIPLDRVERIEIVRGGSSSVFYGDNASGGVINIITRKGEETRYGADVGGGSYNTLRTSAYAEGKEKRLSYALSGSYFTSNGYRLNSGTHTRDAGGSVGYEASDSTRLYFKTGWHKDNTGLPGALMETELAGHSRKDSTHPNDFADTEDYYLQGGTETFFGGGHLFKIDASYRNREVTNFSSFSDGSNFTAETALSNYILSPQVILKPKLGNFDNKLSLGMDLQHANEKINNAPSGDLPKNFDLKKNNYGIYIHDELALTKNLLLSGGYRYDRVVFSFSPSTPDESVFTEHAASAGVNYSVPKNFQVYFNYNRSFRYPVLDEQFNFQANTIAPLQPQTSQGYELGGKYDVTPRLRAGLNLFRINTSSEIFFNPYTPPFGNNENLDGKTVRDGIEASLNWQATDLLTLFATFAYLIKAEVDGGQFDGKWIPGVPRHKATAGATVNITKPLSLNLAGIYLGSRPFSGDFQNSFSDQKSYILVNTKLQYRWRVFRTYLDVNNLTDVKYSEFGVLSNPNFPPVQKAFYPSPGINFLAGLAADF